MSGAADSSLVVRIRFPQPSFWRFLHTRPMPGGWWPAGGREWFTPSDEFIAWLQALYFHITPRGSCYRGKGRKEGRKGGREEEEGEEGVFPSNERAHGVIDRCPPGRGRPRADWSGSYAAFLFHPNFRRFTNLSDTLAVCALSHMS